MFPRHLNILKSNSFFLFGARGTGKTTLLDREFKQENFLKLDLLENSICSRFQADPDELKEVLKKGNQEWIIIDEVQKVPELLDVVHQIIYENRKKFALTGSSARKLKRGASNLLAGRAFVYKMFPLTHLELGDRFNLFDVLSYGSLPKVFSYNSAREKKLFLNAYAETYLKEEILIEQLIRNLPPFRKFLEISAHQDTQVVSYSSIARDVSVDPKIVSNYYSILEDTLLGFFLEPYHTSMRKRQKKSPKFYWFDLGVKRALSGTLDYEITPQSYEFGAVFESFIVNEIYKILKYSEKSFKLSFLRIDENQEIDLILERPNLPLHLIEIKSTNKMNNAHLDRFKKIAKLFEGAIAVVLSRDEIEKVSDNISCLHWQTGLREIGVVDSSASV